MNLSNDCVPEMNCGESFHIVENGGMAVGMSCESLQGVSCNADGLYPQSDLADAFFNQSEQCAEPDRFYY